MLYMCHNNIVLALFIFFPNELHIEHILSNTKYTEFFKLYQISLEYFFLFVHL